MIDDDANGQPKVVWKAIGVWSDKGRPISLHIYQKLQQ